MCANWMYLKNDLDILEKEKIDYIHYDIMDGFFVEDYCLGTSIINEIRKNTSIASEYHLMVEEPSRIFSNFDNPKDGDILGIHYEACRNLHRDLVRINKMGYKVGLILNPATSLSAIEYVIEELDMITIMTVNPGFKGSKLVPQMLQKIKDLKKIRDKFQLNFKICVDGNVNLQNIPEMVTSGTDILVGGSSGLFLEGKSLQENIHNFRLAINKGA